jgi:peptidoglycan/xylan/chitin deacetylase (PgdA/CDA1 family)
MIRGSLVFAFIGGIIVASLGFLWIENTATAQGQGPAAVQGPGQPGTRMTEAELKAKFFEFSGGRTLRPKTWANGARAAVVIGFDANATAGLINNNIAPNAMQQAEFGAESGLPRLLSVLDKHSLPATFFVPPVTAMMYPDMLPSILRSKRHEVAMHGWIHENYSQLPEAEQRRLLKQTIDYLEKATGRRPVGFVPPGANTSVLTFKVAKELGVEYVKAYGSDDPYELTFAGQPSGLIGVPGDWNLNDGTYLGQNGALPDPKQMFELWRQEFDVTYEEGGLMFITMHPGSSGRRTAAARLDEFLGYMKSKPGVWFATARDVVSYVKTTTATN